MVLLGVPALSACEALLDTGGLHDRSSTSSEGGAYDATTDAAPDATGAGDANPADAADANLADSGSNSDSASALDSGSSVDSGPDAPLDAGAQDGQTVFSPYWTFSDGFESGDLRHWTSQSMSNGTLAVVDAGANTGCCALKATGNAGGVAYDSALKMWTTANPVAAAVTSGTVAIRFHLQVFSMAQNTNEIVFAENGAQFGASASAGLKEVSGLQWGLFLENAANPGGKSLVAVGSEQLPQSQYHCVEFVTNVASSQGALSLFVDDRNPPGDGNWYAQQSGVDTLADAGWNSALVGIPFAEGDAGSSVLVDDVTISLYSDLQPVVHIGCP